MQKLPCVVILAPPELQPVLLDVGVSLAAACDSLHLPCGIMPIIHSVNVQHTHTYSKPIVINGVHVSKRTYASLKCILLKTVCHCRHILYICLSHEMIQGVLGCSHL